LKKAEIELLFKNIQDPFLFLQTVIEGNLKWDKNSPYSEQGAKLYIEKILSYKVQPLIKHFIQNYYANTTIIFETGHTYSTGATFFLAYNESCFFSKDNLSIAACPYIYICEEIQNNVSTSMQNLIKLLPQNLSTTPTRQSPQIGNTRTNGRAPEQLLKKPKSKNLLVVMDSSEAEAQLKNHLIKNSLGYGVISSFPPPMKESVELATSSSKASSRATKNNNWFRIQYSATRVFVALCNGDGAEDANLSSFISEIFIEKMKKK